MEVASPLAFAAAASGQKRSLACSPQIMSTPNHGNYSETELADDSVQRSTKRRRFGETTIESLSNAFSSHSPFFQTNQLGTSCAQSLKRLRPDGSSSPHQDISRVVEEQASLIDSLKSDKSNLEAALSSLTADHGRVAKENQLLRKAVNIQQDRHTQAVLEVKEARKNREEAEERIRKLEQMILSLRYHLQAQQTTIGNDFMGMRPPDVF
jgi:hypothetical protein